MIHGPEVGYKNGPKNHYRRQKYAFVERALGPSSNYHVPRKDRRVLLLDEAEGHETFLLISKGYSPSNLHVVNYSAAKLAALQSRVMAETGCKINTYGIDLERALNERVRVEFDVVHLDFTSNLSDAAIRSIHSASRFLKPGAVVIVNAMKGRESKHTLSTDGMWCEDREYIRAWVSRPNLLSRHEISLHDADRIQMAWEALCSEKIGRLLSNGRQQMGVYGCKWHSIDFEFGQYQSGRVPMLWIMAQLSECLIHKSGASGHSWSWNQHMRDHWQTMCSEAQLGRDPRNRLLQLSEVIAGWLNAPSCFSHYMTGVYQNMHDRLNNLTDVKKPVLH